MPRQLIHHNRHFLGIFLLYAVVGAFSFLFYNQGSETLYLDNRHTDLGDHFFLILTNLAEAFSLTILGVILLASRVKYFVMYIAVILVVGVTVVSLKLYVFADHIRPSRFFEATHHLHFVQGMTILRDYSFPSGHTTSAFAVCLLLSTFIRRAWASLMLLAIALLVGLSRMYLLQHFWIDVYFGSLLGVSITFLVYIALQKPIIYSESRILNFSLIEWLTQKNRA